MKYVSLSFDDARADTFNRAFPILRSEKLLATVNVISDFVMNSNSEIFFPSGKKAMTANQLIEWEKCGYEIACHGHTHKNTANDLKMNLEALSTLGVSTSSLGFASPESYITKKNIETTEIDKCLSSGLISYIRSGIQIRREGVIYTFISILESLTHSKKLYYSLNKRGIIFHEDVIYLSVAVKEYTTLEQLVYFIENMPDDSGVIFMFHSILNESDEGYKTDHYFWDEHRFSLFCKYLSSNDGISVLTSKQLIEKVKKHE